MGGAPQKQHKNIKHKKDKKHEKYKKIQENQSSKQVKKVQQIQKKYKIQSTKRTWGKQKAVQKTSKTAPNKKRCNTDTNHIRSQQKAWGKHKNSTEHT